MTYRFLISINIFAFLVGMLCAGCASTSILKQCANGDKWEVRSTRLLWQTEEVRVAMQTNGLPEVTVRKTQADNEAITASAGAIGAIAGAAVKAAK